ncbi:hypothetical protein [Pseudomonas phage Waldo5]|uniref:Uncharacterized protein n=1 Tax=Pseudomonas phage Waldo5 TaxID=2762290 RepID=A0A7G8LJM0_9CAUD|nr:hypothetical protein [Pseudomonas phage Waldo5]
MKLHDQADLKVQHIKFLCLIPGQGVPQLVEFSVGLGPCGRHVEELMVEFNKHFLKITQWSVDELGMLDDPSEIKDFIYMMSDIRGRIVTTR